jgi:hypothetical protein
MPAPRGPHCAIGADARRQSLVTLVRADKEPVVGNPRYRAIAVGAEIRGPKSQTYPWPYFKTARVLAVARGGRNPGVTDPPGLHMTR